MLHNNIINRTFNRTSCMSPTGIPTSWAKCCKWIGLAHLQTLRSWIHLHSYLQWCTDVKSCTWHIAHIEDDLHVNSTFESQIITAYYLEDITGTEDDVPLKCVGTGGTWKYQKPRCLSSLQHFYSLFFSHFCYIQGTPIKSNPLGTRSPAVARMADRTAP